MITNIPLAGSCVEVMLARLLYLLGGESKSSVQKPKPSSISDLQDPTTSQEWSSQDLNKPHSGFPS